VLFLAWFSAFLRNFRPILYNGDIQIQIIDSCVKIRQYFHTHHIPLNSASNSLSCDLVRFKIEVGDDAKFICKNVTLNTRELPAVAAHQQSIAVAILDDLQTAASTC